MGKYHYNKNYFEKIESSNQAYWLGFLYADGCITRFYNNKGNVRSMSLELALQEKDLNHLEKFRIALDSDVPIRRRIISKKYVSYRLVINCTKICQDLIKLGCIPNKSLILKFPTNDIVPDNFMNDFIRGYFDGDGCVSYYENRVYNKNRGKTYNQYSYICMFTGNEQFIYSLKLYLESKHINVSKLEFDKRSKAVSIIIRERENINKFKSLIYYDDYCTNLSRKYDKFFFIENNKDLLINKRSSR